MKIAIHSSKWSFSEEWIDYCKEREIDYKIVNCYANTIIQDIEDCDALLFHHHHTDVKDFLFAKQLLFAVEQSGKKVFPNFNTAWYFDDKIGQKYLLESINAPIVPTLVFYSKEEAIDWVHHTTFPKVFKLRGGAGSTNVKLVKNKKEASKLINKAFGKGFDSYDRWGNLKEVYRLFILKKQSFRDLLESIRRVFYSTKFAKTRGRERGYVLFQDFIENNKFDIRVITIDNKAFAIKRLVRENDFRASGSGFILYDKKEIDVNCVKIAFETSTKLRAQCVAYDFVFDEDNTPLIVEINYGYAHKAYNLCPGYWDINLNWHEGNFKSTDWIIELLIKK